jgi:hypothetical protein
MCGRTFKPPAKAKQVKIFVSGISRAIGGNAPEIASFAVFRQPFLDLRPSLH